MPLLNICTSAYYLFSKYQLLMSNHLIRLIRYALLVVVLLGCGGGATPMPGEQAPDFTLTDLEGNTYRLSELYPNKLVMLYFWSDNCEICKKEFPSVEAYYRDLKKKNFELLAIYIGNDPQPSREFKEQFNVTFPMLVDESAEILNTYNITATPTNYLINPKGVISKRVIGYVDRKQIESLLYNLKMNASK